MGGRRKTLPKCDIPDKSGKTVLDIESWARAIRIGGFGFLHRWTRRPDIPFSDGLVILAHLGFAPPIYIHWGTALYMIIVAAFLLRKKNP
jgi:hypothetical protein